MPHLNSTPPQFNSTPTKLQLDLKLKSTSVSVSTQYGCDIKATQFCYLQWMFDHIHHIELSAVHRLFQSSVRLPSKHHLPNNECQLFYVSDELITSGFKGGSSAESIWRVCRRDVKAALCITVIEALSYYIIEKWCALSFLLSSKGPIEIVPDFSDVEVGQNNLVTGRRSLHQGSYEGTRRH